MTSKAKTVVDPPLHRWEADAGVYVVREWSPGLNRWFYPRSSIGADSDPGGCYRFRTQLGAEQFARKRYGRRVRWEVLTVAEVESDG